MSKKIKIVFILLALILAPSYSFAETDTSNVGFVSSSIWYSDEPDTEGEKVRIYTVVFNPYQKEFSGTVLFYDNDVLIGKKDFVIPSIGTKEVYIEWTVNLGAHKIFARIENTKYRTSKGVYEQVVLKENTSETSSYTVYKKILPNISDLKDNVNTAVDNIKEPVTKIEQKIIANTPDYVSKPIISTSNFLEKWRIAQDETVQARKINVVSEIDAIEKANSEATFLKEEGSVNYNQKEDENKESSKKSVGDDFKTSVSAPFKYIELFFLTLVSYIVGTKIVFYGTLVLIIAIFVRIIWKRFF